MDTVLGGPGKYAEMHTCTTQAHTCTRMHSHAPHTHMHMHAHVHHTHTLNISPKVKQMVKYDLIVAGDNQSLIKHDVPVGLHTAAKPCVCVCVRVHVCACACMRVRTQALTCQ